MRSFIFLPERAKRSPADGSVRRADRSIRRPNCVARPPAPIFLTHHALPTTFGGRSVCGEVVCPTRNDVSSGRSPALESAWRSARDASSGFVSPLRGGSMDAPKSRHTWRERIGWQTYCATQKVLQKQQLLDVGSKLLGKQVGGHDQTVQRIIGSGAEIRARGLDKSAEFEADRIGVVLAARAGYEPWGLPSVLQEMAGIAKGSSSRAAVQDAPGA